MKTKYDGLRAALVWDGTDEVRIPSEAGTPRDDQMIGTAPERLAEVNGRFCYDSMGKNGSRPSSEYHKHILGTGHGSVLGHWHGVFTFPWSALSVEQRFDCLRAVTNRPGIYINLGDAENLRVTTNFRSLTEWGKWTMKYRELGYYRDQRIELAGQGLQASLNGAGWRIAPQIMDAMQSSGKLDAVDVPSVFGVLKDGIQLVEPADDFEKWITVYIEGSRGLTHEEVRHGYMTGISQRSTRFCDEHESPWIMHPLFQEFLVDEEVPIAVREECRLAAAEAERAGKSAYITVVDKLQPWCMKRVPETDKFRKTTARKQARGAGRGYLGNALRTLGGFSGNVAEWLWKFGQRGANAADGEIRAEYVLEILPELKKSRYADRFAHFETEPAIDGVGLVVKGGGNK